MKESIKLPFSKNRYYKGKMLTSADFEAEQSFIEEKNRFLNRLINGTGIGCGLNISAVDEKSILLESGLCFDEMGREIIVDKSTVVKLSSVRGFDDLETDYISLYVGYSEKEVQPVYTVDAQGKYENNRIEEGYELFVKDAQKDGICENNQGFLKKSCLFEDEFYAVQLVAPTVLSAGQFVNLEVVVTGKTEDSASLFMECELTSPGFEFEGEIKEQKIFLEDVKLKKGHSKRFGYWVKICDAVTEETSILVKPGTMKVVVNGVEKTGCEEAVITVAVSDRSPEQIALANVGRESLEEQMVAFQEGVFLANIKLHLTAASYIIEEINGNEQRRYMPLPKGETERLSYLSYFSKNTIQNKEVLAAVEEEKTENTEVLGKRFASGIVEIPLDNKAREGDVYYSGEIMHGLGEGNVYVEVGYEVIEEDQTEVSTRSTVFGNPELFEGKAGQVAVETAVKVLNDKGSFVVAAKLLDNIKLLMLTYRWVAVSLEKNQDIAMREIAGDQSISAVTPTVVLKGKESHFFQAQFHNMKPCTLAYELSEPGSGEITPDGVFTAPAKEGVYEIKIYCAEQPIICTYAYAIVKK